MKIDRLISIIMVLLEKDKISASSLAHMFEVSTRTIYRDIETIQLAGIPIDTTTGFNGGISIFNEYKVDKKFFTSSDIITLLMGLDSVSSTLSNKQISTTLAKIKSLIPEQQYKDIELKSNQIIIDFTSWIGKNRIQPYIEKIKKSLNDSTLLSFQYYSGKNEKTSRTVEPHQLILKESKWYLKAYCLEKSDFRTFKISRMITLNTLETSFTPRTFNPEPPGKLNMPNDLITIKLLVNESLRERMLEVCGDEDITPYKDGRLLILLPFVADDIGYAMLLGYGEKCECIEPQYVRDEFANRLRTMLKKYE